MSHSEEKQGEQGTLDWAVNSAEIDGILPMALPISHISIARWFNTISIDGRLRPLKCGVFDAELLYLFYGGLYYRPSGSPTRNAAELPIAFLFDPMALSEALRFYPFDTGTIAKGLSGEWKARLADFRTRYHVHGRGDDTAPRTLVHHIYGTNPRYLAGSVSENCRVLPAPFPELYEFLSTDLTTFGMDQRQYAIECHFDQPLSLTKHLIWIGCPESMTGEIAKIYEHTKPSMPRYHCYEAHKVVRPAEIAAQLQSKAAEEVKRFVELP